MVRLQLLFGFLPWDPMKKTSLFSSKIMAGASAPDYL